MRAAVPQNSKGKQAMNSERKDVHAIKYKNCQKQKKNPWPNFRSLHSHHQTRYFVEYTGIEVSITSEIHTPTPRDAREKGNHNCKAVDNGLVVMESNGTESEVQDDSSMSGNDTMAEIAIHTHLYEEPNG
ncbi:hypothetical protein Tco_0827551 [Tanacetum coccineum]